jgi:hypothetical protein
MDAKTAVRKHEQNMHPGSKPTKLKAGGKASPVAPKVVNQRSTGRKGA